MTWELSPIRLTVRLGSPAIGFHDIAAEAALSFAGCGDPQMNPYLRSPNLKPGRFRVGDQVRLLVGWRGMEGEVVEDFGNIGVGGRRLYSVRIKPDEWNEMLVPYSDDEMEAVAVK